MKNINMLFIIPFVAMLFSSCKKDSVIDGGVSSPKVNMTTYDYLKSHPRGLFDTLLMIIDKGEMKDLINSKGTMFAPTNYSIKNFLSLRQAQVRAVDERKNYTLDTLFKYFTPKMLRDSMSVYLFPETIVRDGLDANGKEFASKLDNYKFLISLEPHTNDDYNAGGLIPERPKFLYYTRIIGERDVLVAGQIKDPSGNAILLDQKFICQTSGIETTTGVLHVLTNNHTWLRGLRLNIN